MSRRGKRQPARSLLPVWAAVVLVLAIAWSAPAIPAGAQTATQAASTPAAPAATPAATAGASGTPAGTPTTAPSPTATPTLTELQSRLALAAAYLAGQDYDSAAELYGQIAADTRGNPEALEGLRAALNGRAAILATQLAPLPTETPAPVLVEKPVTLASETRAKVLDVLATILAGLLLIVTLYLLAALLRWLLTELRELWYTRILPLLGRPAVPPGILIGDFTVPTGASAESAARIVPIAMTEKLIAWNQLVQDKQTPVEIAPDLNLGTMAWLKVIWNWILPRPRGYRVSGALLAGPAGQHQLAVQRTDLGRNSVDRSRIFESTLQAPAQAYRDMAGEAAKWLVLPADIEADQALAAAKGFDEARSDSSSASDIFDAALNTLLPVRQQVKQGQIAFPDARRRMRDAEVMVAQLPPNSELRAELTRVLADLRKAVPGG